MGGRAKVVSPAMHTSCFVPDRFPQIQRSAGKHRCVRERGRVRGRVVRVAIYSASTKPPMDLELGPARLWKRRIHQPSFVSRIHSGCERGENNWLRCDAAARQLEAGSGFLRGSARSRKRFSIYNRVLRSPPPCYGTSFPCEVAEAQTAVP